MSKVYFSHTTKLRVVKMGLVPASTIAIKKVGDNFHYGVSICSKYDNFSKKYGREIAENRLNQGFGILPVPKPLQDLPEKEACLHQLYNLAASTILKNRKWKRKVTAFNKLKQIGETARIIEMKSYETPTNCA